MPDPSPTIVTLATNPLSDQSDGGARVCQRGDLDCASTMNVPRAFSAMLVSAGTAILLVTIPLVQILSDRAYFAAVQDRHAIGRTTEFGAEEIAPINEAIVRFFASEMSLPDALASTGAPVQVFGDREIDHMEDVRALVRAVGSTRDLGTVLVVLGGGLAILARPRDGLRSVLNAVSRGAAATIGLLALLGAIALADFGALFTQFHLVSFTNDLWMLDPRTDNLIRIFPFGFWLEATLTLAVRCAFWSVLVLVGALTLSALARRRPEGLR